MSFNFGPKHFELTNEVLERVLRETGDINEACAVAQVIWWSLIQTAATLDRRDPKIVAREKSEAFLDQLADQFTLGDRYSL